MDQSLSTRPRVCFEVEKVIGVSSDGNVRTYQVQWAPAWVSSFHLVGCEHLIQEFLKRQSLGNEPDEYPSNIAENKHVESMGEVEVPYFSTSDRIPGREVVENNFESNAYDCNLTIFQPQDAAAMTDDTYSNAVSDHVQNYMESSCLNSEKDGDVPSDRYEVVKVEDDDAIIEDNLVDSQPNVDTDLPFPPHAGQSGIEEETYITENYPLFSAKMCSDKNTTAKKSNMPELDRPKQVIKRFRCMQCDKAYSNSSGLKFHLNTHTGDRPYTCDLCNRGFNQNSDLQRHLRMHTGVKPFVCAVCGKGFSRRIYLKSHMSTHDPT